MLYKDELVRRMNETDDEYFQRVLLHLAMDREYIARKHYNGELGAIYSPDYTDFKLWAPTAEKVELIVYDGHYGKVDQVIPMEFIDKENHYHYRMEGDCHGLTYRYQITFIGGRVSTSMDPYAQAVTINGRRSVVVDLSRTNPAGWGQRMEPFEDWSQAVVYELHVRDFSSDPNSGIKHQGKYLGVIEEGTTNEEGLATGLDYLKSLGVTHVEFLPLFDFATIDETVEINPEYNWGYDPLNYNAPEGSYSTNPYDPFNRITELKQMIQGLHEAGIRVIMDVVYNHVYQVERQSFHKTVPGYFYRYDENGHLSNGTGVGNDTASERFMMRKYMIESVKYWAEEYHIDGFRFDLMGIHDINTMNEIRQALDEIDPSILMFGEGWNLMTPLSSTKKAAMHNAKEMPRIGQFNDGLREALKGNDFQIEARGFINGAWHMEKQLAYNFMGRNALEYLSPLQLIQYVEAHDNYTLYDRLVATDGTGDMETLVKRHELATTIILLAQGIPFIHAGQEFLRSKQGVRDSYNKPDKINRLEWKRIGDYQGSVQLFKDLVALRHSEPYLRMSTYDEIEASMVNLLAESQLVTFRYDHPEKDYELFLILNGRGTDVNYPIPTAEYILKVHNRQVYLDDETIQHFEHEIHVPAYTVSLLKKYKHKEVIKKLGMTEDIANDAQVIDDEK